MLVKYWMNKDFATLDVNDSMQEAVNLMKQRKLSMLPVMKGGTIVGVITDRDLKRASASDATTLSVHELIYLLSQIKCHTIMTKDPVVVPPDFTLEETADALLSHKISGAPVVDDKGKLVGTISQHEIFEAFVSMSGLPNRGVQFAFLVDDAPGSIKQVTDVIRSYGGRLVSILTSYDRAPAGFRHVYVRVHSIDRGRLEGLKEDLRKNASLLYMVDHLENRREEFGDAGKVA